ncbi:MAG: alkaline phosphatase family protein [Planctomycetes bacterium]|nr:alkaline phosphatase family protein [Planctomycetota bacterium]
MTSAESKPLPRRSFLKTAGATVAGAAAVGAAAHWIGGVNRVSRSAGKKVIVIGFDGMDPQLCASMMKEGLLPNFQKMSQAGGFSPLGTSIPPQSPVAWANFINGAGPGSHGIFDFIHRHPEQPQQPFFSAAETLPAEGGWEWGDHKLQLDFWPFEHQPAKTVLRRQGIPFWDYLDAQGIPTTFYDLPSNYPPSPSHYGHHRCLCGMGTPDMQGSYGTYQYFSEDTPLKGVTEGGGMRSRLRFEKDTAQARIVGPDNSLLKSPRPVKVEFRIHRDKAANAAVLEIQGRRIVLRSGEWSPWTKLNFTFSAPALLPAPAITGIVRFYLQEVSPNFRLYVSPVNIDPSAPAVQISEPAGFATDVSKSLGLFATTGFQEDHKARSNGVFVDDEYLRQAGHVLDERMALFEYAIENYDDGLLFFYFSSSDLQSHMFWWNTDERHPTRSGPEAQRYFEHIRRLYQRLDGVIGDLYDRYGSRATIFVMSDHGFANFGRQFNLNTWLRQTGYLNPGDCTSVCRDVDWSQTRAYGLGINGLYLNLKGREADGTVEPGTEQSQLSAELQKRLEDIRDVDGRKVIRSVYRADTVYSGTATALAPDLIIGYARGYRASWGTCLGDLTEDVLTDNTAAWSADHCADALEVPGVLCCSQAIRHKNPSLIDIAPSILDEFSVPVPATMTGRSIFVS